DGTRSLILGEADDFIQVETPSSLGTPPPTNQNNIGRECFPINTAFELACDALVNPANGNLALPIQDLHLPSYRLDLTLSRTYNSRAVAQDSPFGMGWSASYLPDFNAPFEDGVRLLDA